MNIDLSRNNGPDTYTVSQNSPLFDLLDNIVETQRPEDALATLANYVATVQADLDTHVAQCRKAGLSWQAIGDHLAMTKQGAQQKYAGLELELG